MLRQKNGFLIKKTCTGTIFRKTEQMFFEDFEVSDVFSGTFRPVHQYGHPNFGVKMLKNILTYYRFMFRHLTLSRVYFQVRKHCQPF